jgi:hypothetical protein
MSSPPRAHAVTARRLLLPAGCAALALAAALAALALAAPRASAAPLEVGVYQDNPVAGVPALTKASGKRATRVISTYVTGGRTVDPKIVALAARTKARLLVTWMPDGGRDGANQKRYRLASIRRGAQDAGLKRLAKQLGRLRPAPILRPMPEPNAPWYAWSGFVNSNTPADYVAAWTRVRKVVKRSGGRRVQLMWAPYVRSIPDTPENAFAAYFPGPAQVDLVGTSGYNFGTTGGLAWTDPEPLFEDAYRQVSALATKPFWIAETGSTGTGGSKVKWIRSLATLRTSIPNLAGIVWFDVRDRNGDFRVSGSKATRSAFKAFTGKARAK